MFKSIKKKTTAPKTTSLGGFKIVASPKSQKRREMLSGQDITGSGGCRTRHHQHAQ